MELHSGVCGMCSSKGLILDSRDSRKYFNILCSCFHDELNNISKVQEYYKDIELCPECAHHITLVDIKREYFSSRDGTENSESNDRCAFCVEGTNLLSIHDNSFLTKCKSWTNIETGVTLCVSCYFLIHVRNTLKNNIILELEKDDHATRRKSKEKDHVTLNNGHQANIHSDVMIRPSTSVEACSVPVSNKRKRNRIQLNESWHSHENTHLKKSKLEMSEVFTNDELSNFDMSNILGLSPLCVSSFILPNECKIDKKIFNYIPFVKMRQINEEIPEIVQPNYICSLVSQRNMIRVRRTPPIKIKSIKNLMKMKNKSKSIRKKLKSHPTENLSRNKLIVRVERMKLPLQENSTENTSICESEHTYEHVTPKKKKRVHFNDTPTIIITDDSYFDDIEEREKGSKRTRNTRSKKITDTDQEKTENVGVEEQPVEEQSDEEEPISLSIDMDSDDNTEEVSENTEEVSENTEEVSENTEEVSENTEEVSENTEEVSENTEEVSENTEKVSENTEEVSENIEEVSENTDEVSENDKNVDKDTEKVKTSSCEKSDEKQEEGKQCEEILDDEHQISDTEEHEMEKPEQSKHVEENLSEADKASHQQIKDNTHEVSFVASGNIVEINVDSEEQSSCTNKIDQVKDSNSDSIRENGDNQVQTSTDLTNKSEDSSSNNSDNKGNNLNLAPTDIPKELEVETEKSDSECPDKNISKGKDDDDTAMNHANQVDEPNPKLDEEKGENQKINNAINEVAEDEKRGENPENSNTTNVVEGEDADEIDSLDGFEVIDQDNDACEVGNVSEVTVEPGDIDRLLKKYSKEDCEKESAQLSKQIDGQEEGDVNKSKSLEPEKASVDFGSLIDEVQKCLFTKRVEEPSVQQDEESAALSLLEILEDSFEENNLDEGVAKKKSSEDDNDRPNEEEKT